MSYRIDLAKRIDEIDASEWNALVGRRPFLGRRWLRFIESVMQGYDPCYVLLRNEGGLVAAATCCHQPFYYIPYLGGRLAKMVAQRIMRWFPLYSCENPMTEMSGLVFQEGASNVTTARALFDGVRSVAFQSRAFLLGFDYLSDAESALLERAGAGCCLSAMPPDTYLDVTWTTFEEYVGSLGYRKRKNARHDLRRATQKGYSVERWIRYAGRSDSLYALLAKVHRKHGEPAVPVGRNVYAEAERLLPDTVVLAVQQEGQVVACEVVFRDGDTLLPKLVGLEYAHASLAYSLLAYEEIRYAIESGARRIYMGTTGYQFKERLGCRTEARHYALMTRSGILNSVLTSMGPDRPVSEPDRLGRGSAT